MAIKTILSCRVYNGVIALLQLLLWGNLSVCVFGAVVCKVTLFAGNSSLLDISQGEKW